VERVVPSVAGEIGQSQLSHKRAWPQHWNMGIQSDGKLFCNPLWRNPGLPELSRDRLLRSDGGSNLDGMTFCLIRFDPFDDVYCDLAFL
jgi:hypothetical protein